MSQLQEAFTGVTSSLMGQELAVRDDNTSLALKSESTGQTEDPPLSPSELESNPFAQLMLGPEGTSEQKLDALAELLTYDKDQSPEQNLRRLQQYIQYMRYEKYEGERMLDIANPGSSNLFAAHQNIFSQISEAMDKLDDTMNPLVEIIDIVNTEGPELILKLYKSLAVDKAKKENYEQQCAKLKMEVAFLIERNRAIDREIAALNAGKVKKEEKSTIARLKIEKAHLGEKISAQSATLLDLFARPPLELYPEFKKQKEIIRELLECSGPEWEERARDLLSRTQDFMNMIDERSQKLLNLYQEQRQDINMMNAALTEQRVIYEHLIAAGMIALGRNMATNDESSAVFISELKQSILDIKKIRGQLEQKNAELEKMRADNLEQISEVQKMLSDTCASVAARQTSSISTVTAAVTSLSGGGRNEEIMGELRRITHGPAIGMAGIPRQLDAPQKPVAALPPPVQETDSYMKGLKTKLSHAQDERQKLEAAYTTGLHQFVSSFLEPEIDAEGLSVFITAGGGDENAAQLFKTRVDDSRRASAELVVLEKANGTLGDAVQSNQESSSSLSALQAEEKEKERDFARYNERLAEIDTFNEKAREQREELKIHETSLKIFSVSVDMFLNTDIRQRDLDSRGIKISLQHLRNGRKLIQAYEAEYQEEVKEALDNRDKLACRLITLSMEIPLETAGKEASAIRISLLRPVIERIIDEDKVRRDLTGKIVGLFSDQAFSDAVAAALADKFPAKLAEDRARLETLRKTEASLRRQIDRRMPASANSRGQTTLASEQANAPLMLKKKPMMRV